MKCTTNLSIKEGIWYVEIKISVCIVFSSAFVVECLSGNINIELAQIRPPILMKHVPIIDNLSRRCKPAFYNSTDKDLYASVRTIGKNKATRLLLSAHSLSAMGMYHLMKSKKIRTGWKAVAGCVALLDVGYGRAGLLINVAKACMTQMVAGR